MSKTKVRIEAEVTFDHPVSQNWATDIPRELSNTLGENVVVTDWWAVEPVEDDSDQPMLTFDNFPIDFSKEL